MVSDLGQQLDKQRSNANLAGEELAEAKKSAAQAKVGESRALDEARVAQASVAQLQASITETIRQLMDTTSASRVADGIFSMTANDASQIDDIHPTNAFRPNRVGAELPQVTEENHRLVRERDEACKELQKGVLATLLQIIAKVRRDRNTLMRERDEAVAKSA